MVAEESKLFTHFPDIDFEIVAPLLVKIICKLFLVRRMALEVGEGLMDVLPSRVNLISNRRHPEVPPVALALADRQNSCYSNFRKSETIGKAATTCLLQLR